MKTGEDDASTGRDKYDRFLRFIPNIQQSYHDPRELPGVLNFRRTHGHHFSALAVMTGRWLPNLPTSAAPERLVSSCGFVLDRLRAGRLPEKMAVAILLHCNSTVIPDSRATEEAYFSKFGTPGDEDDVCDE